MPNLSQFNPFSTTAKPDIGLKAFMIVLFILFFLSFFLSSFLSSFLSLFFSRFFSSFLSSYFPMLYLTSLYRNPWVNPKTEPKFDTRILIQDLFTDPMNLNSEPRSYTLILWFSALIGIMNPAPVYWFWTRILTLILSLNLVSWF